MTKATRQRHYGANGDIKFVPHRNLYVGFWDGKVRVTRRTHDACAEFLARVYGAVNTMMPTAAKEAARIQPKAVVGQELQAFVDRENRHTKLFSPSRALLDLASAADRQTVADRIDCQLSPENLSCDGELPRSEVQARYRSLSRAAAQLLQLDPSVKFYEYSE